MTSVFTIDGRQIGTAMPPYIIAELSANHNGCLARAMQTIDAAKRHGAHAIKIQTYTPDTMTIDCDREDFIVRGGLWDGYSLYRLYDEAHTPYAWHDALFAYARNGGITLFSTPFDETAVELLESLEAPAYKIASFELTDLPLIRAVASTGKPVLMSTGMSSMQEIGDALETARSAGASSLLLFHCISSYPAPLDDANLATIGLLKREFDVEVGLSDHTLGNTAAITATALGASVIEKHFTLNRTEAGPDSTFSMEPAELENLVTDTRGAWLAVGTALKARPRAEDNSRIFRRSLYFVADLKAGSVVERTHVRRIRPGHGLPPRHFDAVVGRTVAHDVSRGDPVSWAAIGEADRS